jgi:hypothetical protein
MIDSGLWPQVVARAIKAHDTLLFSLMRHVCEHKRSRGRLAQMMATDSSVSAMWMHDLVRLAASSEENPDLLVEVLGTLAAMETPFVKWYDICERSGLVDFLQRLLVSGFSDDDVVLVCVIIVGVLAQDEECVPVLLASKLMTVLEGLISGKREDEEIMVQLLFAFRCLLSHDDSQEVLVYDTHVPAGIIELARDKSEAVRTQADEALQRIQDIEMRSRRKSVWSDRIKMARFESFNFEWCHAVLHEGEPTSPSIGSPLSPIEPKSATSNLRSSFSLRWNDASQLE